MYSIHDTYSIHDIQSMMFDPWCTKRQLSRLRPSLGWCAVMHGTLLLPRAKESTQQIAGISVNNELSCPRQRIAQHYTNSQTSNDAHGTAGMIDGDEIDPRGVSRVRATGLSCPPQALSSSAYLEYSGGHLPLHDYDAVLREDTLRLVLVHVTLR